jgi:hypothetical protein
MLAKLGVGERRGGGDAFCCCVVRREREERGHFRDLWGHLMVSKDGMCTKITVYDKLTISHDV